MHSNEKKRLRESFLLDQFLAQQGIKPKNIKQLKPPNPDFLIDLDGRIVGIELTEIFVRADKSKKHPQTTDEPLLQEFESITDRIVSHAREIYFEANDTLVLSRIVFSQITRDKQKGKHLSELIADKIRDMISENSSDVVTWKPNEHASESQFLYEAVTFISIDRVPEKRFARWKAVRVGRVANLTPDHLQERINLKAHKLKNYGKNSDIEEIWLLMVADRTRPSQMLRRSADFPLESLSSPFARTFYYSYASDEPVIEI